jgi:hypothetical protein
VQKQRKKLLAWQNKYNRGLVDIEDNQYEDGKKTPHRYRVHIARVAAETLLDARASLNWQKHKFNEAMKESAETMLASLPEFPVHVRHGRWRRTDAESTMERDLKCALTKVRKVQQTNELTGNNIDLTVTMVESINEIRVLLAAIEKAGSAPVRSEQIFIVE